jgi:hypothetical protein
MLGALCLLMMSAFLLFDSDFSSPVAENRTIFAVLSAMLVTILQVRVYFMMFTFSLVSIMQLRQALSLRIALFLAPASCPALYQYMRYC